MMAETQTQRKLKKNQDDLHAEHINDETEGLILQNVMNELQKSCSKVNPIRIAMAIFRKVLLKISKSLSCARPQLVEKIIALGTDRSKDIGHFLCASRLSVTELQTVLQSYWKPEKKDDGPRQYDKASKFVLSCISTYAIFQNGWQLVQWKEREGYGANRTL